MLVIAASMLRKFGVLFEPKLRAAEFVTGASKVTQELMSIALALLLIGAFTEVFIVAVSWTPPAEALTSGAFK